MTRLEANRILVKILAQYIEQYPDIRFGQALSNLNMVKNSEAYEAFDLSNDRLKAQVWIDEFYLESFDLLKRVMEK